MSLSALLLLSVRLLVVAALAFGGVAAAQDAGASAPSPSSAKPVQAAKVHVVKIRGMRFVPETVEVSVGDTVIWENTDVLPHTATAKKSKAGDVRLFDSKTLAPKASYRYVTTTPGSTPYVCTLHPGMRGTLVVR